MTKRTRSRNQKSGNASSAAPPPGKVQVKQALQKPQKAGKPRFNKAQLLHMVKILDNAAIGAFASFGAFQLAKPVMGWTSVAVCAILYVLIQIICLAILTLVED